MTAATATLAWLVNGYRRALERFDATADQRDAEERFIPLFEALNWAVAISDYPGSSVRVDDTIRGLRFARNRVHHQWADAIEARDIRLPQLTRPAGGG